MKYLFPICLLFLSYNLMSQCIGDFEPPKELQNDYRKMVDLTHGSVGFSLTPQSFYDSDPEKEWFSAGFTKGIWLGGFDQEGNLKLAASAYPRSDYTDFTSGPILSGISAS